MDVPAPLTQGAAVHKVSFELLDERNNIVPLEHVYNHHVCLCCCFLIPDHPVPVRFLSIPGFLFLQKKVDLIAYYF